MCSCWMKCTMSKRYLLYKATMSFNFALHIKLCKETTSDPVCPNIRLVMNDNFEQELVNNTMLVICLHTCSNQLEWSVSSTTEAHTSTHISLCKGAHWIPCWEDNRFHFKNVHYVLWYKRFVHHDLKHKLLEPITAHHQVSLLSTLITPRVLHTELSWIPCCLKTNKTN